MLGIRITIYTIAAAPSDPSILYAGSETGVLYKSTDKGLNWVPFDRFNWGRAVLSIAIHPTDADIVYAATSTDIFKTGNGGESWSIVYTEAGLSCNALAISPTTPSTVFAGTAQGLKKSLDGGANWTDITPPDMERHTRISIVEASRHDAGTAYVAAKRYQMDDRAPYLWRTRDYGQTWDRIVDGIRADDFPHTVREDPVRPGMLYAGGEHEVWVSWNAGDHWQSLSLNLPDTQMTDIIVEDHDLVVGTHGRSVWVLEDIDALRQIDGRAPEATTLFEPRVATRSVNQGVVSYWLPEQADRVELEILDAAGEIVAGFSGTEPEARSGAGGGGFFFGGAATSTPTTAAGMNRFTWDLRYPGATSFDGMIIWSGRPQRGPTAPPGEYQVRVTADGESRTTALTVRMDPRLKGITQEDLEEQFRLASTIRDATSAANEAVIEIRRVRAALREQLAAGVEADLQGRADAFIARITAVEEDLYQVRNQSGQDPLNFPIKLNNRFASLRSSVQRGDARPTDAAYVVFDELRAELDAHLVELEEALSTDLPALNQALENAGRTPIPGRTE